MLDWLRRRRLSDDARRRLILALARSEELVIETHVENVIDVVAAVGDELPLDRALDVYLEAMDPGDTRATLIARRVLARMQTRSAASHSRARRGARSSRRLLHRDDERD